MRTTKLTRYLIAQLLTTGIALSQVPGKQIGGCAGCFSEPQSTLFFGPIHGDTDYADFTLVAPSGNFIVPQLSGSMGHHVSPLRAISPSGDRIAGGITFMLNADIVKCDPQIKEWCDPKPKPIFKSVIGVYSVRDKTWMQHGDFCEVGSAAFSSDGNKVAFVAGRGCTVASGDDGLMILDLETGQMTPVPGAGLINGFWELSWSPDGKFLAITGERGCGQIVCGHIVLIDVATGEMKTIAEGTDPSWSPKGDWIAYSLGVQCMIIHPDGTGARSVLEEERKWMNYALNAPIVWSPDGERLLLNQQQIDGGHTRVIMVDLPTGHAIMKSKNGAAAVMGWVPYSEK